MHIILKRSGIVIAMVWLLINGLLLWQKGIGTTGEAGKYIRQSYILVQSGHLETPNLLLYSVEIVLLAGCIKLHISQGWVVVLQLLANGAATFFFFSTIAKVLKSRATALVVTILLLLAIPYQQLNISLQTESLFQSFTLVFICLLIRQTSVSPGSIIIVLLAMPILALTRPTGLLYWPAAICWLLTVALAGTSPAWKVGLVLFSTLLFLLVLDMALGSGGELDFMLPFREEHIICGCPTLDHPRSIPIHGSGNSVYSLFYYITHDFSRFIRLAWLKTLSFWEVRRNYYSHRHNIYLVAYFCPVTLGAMLSFPYWKRHASLTARYLLIPILLTWGTVILTCDDWNNRFFLGIFPFVLFLAAPLIQKITPAGDNGASGTIASGTSFHNRY